MGRKICSMLVTLVWNIFFHPPNDFCTQAGLNDVIAHGRVQGCQVLAVPVLADKKNPGRNSLPIVLPLVQEGAELGTVNIPPFHCC